MKNSRFMFRVWNKNTHSFTTGGAIKFGGLCFVDEEDFGIKLAEDQDNYIIEQCTGLKDKNGNLIYEGDIVIGRKEIVVCEMIEYKDVVEYKDGAYFPFNWTGVYKPEKFEIIGNIHEQKDNK